MTPATRQRGTAQAATARPGDGQPRSTASDSPRARLCGLGAGVLSLPELFRVVLDPRDASPSAADASIRLMGSFADGDGGGPLRALARASPGDIARRTGLPLASAARLVAAIELGRRTMEEKIPARTPLCTAREIFEFMRWRLRDLVQEECHVLLLNARNEALRRVPLTIGTVDEALITPREVFRAALLEGACRVAVVHNHPSGDPAPSAEDRHVTRVLAAAGEAIGVDFVDHVIIAGERFFSFREAGELPPSKSR